MSLGKESEFVWLSGRDKEGSATALGNIEVKDKSLLLQRNSKERLERGRDCFLSVSPGYGYIRRPQTMSKRIEAVHKPFILQMCILNAIIQHA